MTKHEKREKRIRKRYIKEHGADVTQVVREMNRRQGNSFAVPIWEKEAFVIAIAEQWQTTYDFGYKKGYAARRAEEKSDATE